MPTLPSVPWYGIAQPATRPSSRGAGAVALAQWISAGETVIATRRASRQAAREPGCTEPA